jgi:hypothetical protein
MRRLFDAQVDQVEEVMGAWKTILVNSGRRIP